MRSILIVFLFFLISCNSNKSEEEMEELWSKSQTRQSILDRSGTKFNSAMDMELAMRDAETRLQSGGGLLGKGGLSFECILGSQKTKDVVSSPTSMSVNVFLWRVLIFSSIPVIPMPEILEIIPGKNSETKALLKPTVSKLHPPL